MLTFAEPSSTAPCATFVYSAATTPSLQVQLGSILFALPASAMRPKYSTQVPSPVFASVTSWV